MAKPDELLNPRRTRVRELEPPGNVYRRTPREEVTMAEHLYPGVYVEEYDAHPRAIPGVSASTAMRWRNRSPASSGRSSGGSSRTGRSWRLGSRRHDSRDACVAVRRAAHRLTPLPEQGRRAAMRALATLSAIAGPAGLEAGGSRARIISPRGSSTPPRYRPNRITTAPSFTVTTWPCTGSGSSRGWRSRLRKRPPHRMAGFG